MRVEIHAVGRMKAGPEKELADRFLERFAKVGPGVGLEFAGVAETPESRARDAATRKREEGEKLRRQIGPGTMLVLLDERGRDISSQGLAEKLGSWRDNGARTLIIAIGGADGHDDSLYAGADLVISFGAATWPHQLVRIMLAE